MTEQTIYDPVFSARILESLTFLISERSYVISQNSAKSLCQKIIMLKKKMESPFQTRYNCGWIRFSCYCSDRVFRKIDDVNIWRVKGTIALLHPFFKLIILVHNFMLITLTFFKQLGSSISPQTCLYFQDFRGSKFLNDCFEVWPSNLCLLPC